MVSINVDSSKFRPNSFLSSIKTLSSLLPIGNSCAPAGSHKQHIESNCVVFLIKKGSLFTDMHASNM